MNLLEIIVMYALWLKAKGHIDWVDIMCQKDTSFQRWLEIFSAYPESWKLAQMKRFFTNENPFNEQEFIS